MKASDNRNHWKVQHKINQGNHLVCRGSYADEWMGKDIFRHVVFSLILDCVKSPTGQWSWGPLRQHSCNQATLLLSREVLAELTMMHRPGSILCALFSSSSFQTAFPTKPARLHMGRAAARTGWAGAEVTPARDTSGVCFDTELPYLSTSRNVLRLPRTLWTSTKTSWT